jgi:hypothetical protein
MQNSRNTGSVVNANKSQKKYILTQKKDISA